MNKLFNLLFTFIFTLLLGTTCVKAQTYRSWVNAGDHAMATGRYAEAVDYYSKAMEFEVEDVRLYYNMAQVNRLYNDYEKAAAWYLKTYSDDKEGSFELTPYYIADMKMYLGQYDEAVKFYNIYLSSHGADSSYFTVKSKTTVNAIEESKSIASSDQKNVEVENAGNRINSTYSDFGGITLGDSILYYSSLRFKYEDREDKKADTKYVSRILRSKEKEKSFEIPEPLFMLINEPSVHNCNIAISKDHQIMVFTRCDYKADFTLRCDLFISKYQDGKWTKPTPFPAEVNDKDYTNTHPAIEAIGAEGWNIYFTSDKPGGFGNLDLYKVKIDANLNFSVVENLGEPINTFDDELSPFYDSERDVLYFSSNGLTGMGGYDIFSSTNINGTFQRPVNMGPPYNSSVNDLYFTLGSDSTYGTLTSNRIGSYYIRSKTCCYDIWLHKQTFEEPVLAVDSSLQQGGGIAAGVENSGDPIVRATYDDLLPLILYFENDQPNPKSMATTTQIKYDDLYKTYIANYQDYMSGHTDGLSGEDYKLAATSIESFFNKKVKASYKRLEIFSNKVLEALQQNAVIKITVRGQASPLADTKYNVNLSKRRVASLVNYLMAFNDEALQPYFNTKALIIEEVAAGESLSAKTVSDNLNDKRNSVYSPEASQERLIEVIDIKIDVPEQEDE